MENMDLNTFLSCVEGWVIPEIPGEILDTLAEFQNINSVSGAVMEIGIHHGKFFIPIHNKICDNECSYAVDVFDMQEFNVDGSGCGNLEAFQQNLLKFGKTPEKCNIIKADSTAWDYTDIDYAEEKVNRRLRIISIDGSHTMSATFIDLLECEKRLVSGGIIFIDDYTNVHWPGVACGVNKFFLQYAPRVAPFFFGLNKLILCHVSWHEKYLELIKNLTANKCDTKLVEMFGYKLYGVMSWR